MREKYGWAQDTPIMQLASIMQAIYGTTSNMKDGIGNPLNQAAFILSMGEQLQALAPFLVKNEW